jgi:hypothetical protein
MKKQDFILFFIIGLLIPLASSAQIQKGIVKTRGRMVNGTLQQGTGLSGTTIQLKERTALLSKVDGTFSFPLRTDKYQLQSVMKQGYELVDAETCRSYHYSDNPLIIVMETPEQQRSDQLAAQRKIRQSLQQQLAQKEKEIEALNISLTEKEKLLDRLYQQQSENESLITEMVARYATIDYDQIDDFYRQVSYCIEQGELVRADSLLRSRGDVNDQVANQLREEEAVLQEKKQLAKIEATLQVNKKELARRCFSYYESFCLQHQNDSAAHYIDLRATLDTTCLEWQFQAANYHSRQHHTDKAEHYYLRILGQIENMSFDSRSDFLSIQAATKNNLGLLYEHTKQTDMSESCYQDALRIRKELANSNQHHYVPQVVQTTINLGMLYAAKNRFDVSEELLTEAISVLDSLALEQPQKYMPMIAATQSNVATLYIGSNNIEHQTLALHLTERALAIYRKLAQYAPQQYEADVAATLSNLSLLYFRMDKPTEGRPCYQEAIDIYARLARQNPNAYRLSLNGLIDNLTHMAIEMNNKGYAREKIDSLRQARTYYEESLAIYQKLTQLQPELYKSYVARELGNLSFNAILMRNFEQAESYARHGIDIDPNKLFIYANLAEALMLQSKQQEAESIVTNHLPGIKETLLEDLDNLTRRGIISNQVQAGAERIKALILKTNKK